MHQIGDESIQLMMEALSDDEFRSMPFYAKLKFLANQREIVPARIKGSFAFATCVFFSVCLSELYCTIHYSIKDLFPNYTDQQIYFLKVSD